MRIKIDVLMESFLKVKKNIQEYGGKFQPKKGVNVDYYREIADRTGTNYKAVKEFCDRNSIEPLDLLQGIGSKRVDVKDFAAALLSSRGERMFLSKFNPKSIWKDNSVKEERSRTIKSHRSGKLN